ncbi:MAG: hypothetical protein ACC646_03940 [Paracoccaceae bacterium]
MHIGKNAGTQINRVADRFNDVSTRFRIVAHPHHETLRDLPRSGQYFFSIRNPVSRFESGFLSRQRKGQPRILSEWTPHEAIAFSEFSDANSLAESLFRDGETGTKAYKAMRSISHVAMNQHHWFVQAGQFLQLRPPLHIIRQENFASDLAVFLGKVGFDEAPDITDDAVAAHKNDYSGHQKLSAGAIRNLERWYAVDIEFYKICNEWIAKNS